MGFFIREDLKKVDCQSPTKMSITHSRTLAQICRDGYYTIIECKKLYDGHGKEIIWSYLLLIQHFRILKRNDQIWGELCKICHFHYAIIHCAHINPEKH